MDPVEDDFMAENQRPRGGQSPPAGPETGPLKEEILRHIRSGLGQDPYRPDGRAAFMGLAFSVRDRLIDRWLKSQSALYDTLAKRVYFLSLEFLPGRFLKNYLLSLDMVEEAEAAIKELGFDLEELRQLAETGKPLGDPAVRTAGAGPVLRPDRVLPGRPGPAPLPLGRR
jgi:starch phosphorylase